MSSSSSEYQLSRKEVDFFVANGYLGPYAAMSPEAMALIRREIEEKVLCADGPNPRSRVQSRHILKETCGSILPISQWSMTSPPIRPSSTASPACWDRISSFGRQISG